MMNEGLAKMEEEGFVEQVVEKRLRRTIEEIVDESFRSYSDFGKNLKGHITQNLNINFDELKLEGYNTLVLTAVKEQLDKIIIVQGIEKIKASLDEMLIDYKEEYTLSEIIEKFKEHTDKEDFDSDDKIGLIIQDSCGYKHIYINETHLDYKHQYEYRISINREGKAYSIKIKNQEIDKNKIMEGLYGFEKLLFRIYASGAKIALDKGTDPDEYDLYYSDED